MNFISIIKTVRQEMQNIVNDARMQSPVLLTAPEENILFELKKKGFFVIPDFYTREECRTITGEIDALLETYKNQIFKDDEGSDHRIFGADRLSPTIRKFYDNPFIHKIMYAHEKTKKINGLTMAAKLEYKANNIGSGGGWHRDWAVNKQIKAIVYLTDVGENNGPFQFIEGSHSHTSLIKESMLNNFNFNQNRFTDEEISRILRRNTNILQTLTGKAGTLILVNTRGLHRGMPIEKGVRYALTNYYWSNMPIPSHVEALVVKQHG